MLLSIAGFDPSSGAGVTADLQVFAAHGCFGTSAITALTVQSTRGLTEVQPVSPGLLARTLAELQADLPPAGIKIGMLGSAGVVKVVADFLQQLPPHPLVVLDPVLRSSSGAGLLEADALEELQTTLLPLVNWITPNWTELAALSGREVHNENEASVAMNQLAGRYPHLGVIATGGDLPDPVDLVRLPDSTLERIRGQHVNTASTHGTGCAFSSALLCGLVSGLAPVAAAKQAKRYVEGALRHAPGLGHSRGPMDLLWPRKRPSHEAFHEAGTLGD